MHDIVNGHVICNLQCELYIKKKTYHNGTHWYVYVLLVGTILAFGTQTSCSKDFSASIIVHI